MKLKVTQKGVRRAGESLEVGTVLDIEGDTIPASLIGKVSEVEGGRTAKTAVTNPTDGALPEYEAKHRGGGSYSVIKGDAEVMSGLSKDDAATFDAMSDAMSDADKTEYLSTEAE